MKQYLEYLGLSIGECHLTKSVTKGKLFPAVTSKWFLQQTGSALHVVCPASVWVTWGIFLFNTWDCQQQRLLKSQNRETTVKHVFSYFFSHIMIFIILTSAGLRSLVGRWKKKNTKKPRPNNKENWCVSLDHPVSFSWMTEQRM